MGSSARNARSIKERRSFPVAELLEFLEVRARSRDLTVIEYVGREFGQDSAYYRHAFRLINNPDGRMNWVTADQWASGLGVHASSIWPEWFPLFAA